MLFESGLPGFAVRTGFLETCRVAVKRPRHSLDHNAPHFGGVSIQPVHLKGHGGAAEEGTEFRAGGRAENHRFADSHEVHGKDLGDRTVDHGQPPDIGGLQILPAVSRGENFRVRL